MLQNFAQSIPVSNSETTKCGADQETIGADETIYHVARNKTCRNTHAEVLAKLHASYIHLHINAPSNKLYK